MSKQPTETPQPTLNRRRFLGGVLVAGAGATVAATLPVEQTPEPVAQAEPEAPVSKGYRETAHIRDYYKTADL